MMGLTHPLPDLSHLGDVATPRSRFSAGMDLNDEHMGSGRDGWHMLTPAECRVVALVAEGRSNAEVGVELFVSRRTVDNHLYRIFTKLAIPNRVTLAVLAASWGPLERVG